MGSIGCPCKLLSRLCSVPVSRTHHELHTILSDFTGFHSLCRTLPATFFTLHKQLGENI